MTSGNTSFSSVDGIGSNIHVVVLADVAEASSEHFSPNRSAPGSSERYNGTGSIFS